MCSGCPRSKPGRTRELSGERGAPQPPGGVFWGRTDGGRKSFSPSRARLRYITVVQVSDSDAGRSSDHPRWFATTHWSVVLAAKQGGSSESAGALEWLCRTYWYPLYAFLRREGRSPHDAQDLTQSFFARLLQGRFLENVGPQKGKFRSFLLAALKNFLCDERDRATAEKRGGGQTFISLDDHNAEEWYLLEPDAGVPPERVFEQRWALTLLAQALAGLREEYAAAGKTQEFDHLKVFLATPTSDGAYDDMTVKLGMTVDNIAVKVHRLRQRYGEFIRAEIAQTVACPADIDEELQHLFNVVGR
ncbi:MAG: sigma-70 family RNA polymerase sigma factor [Verrucomicrobia bacterium]|nr:sigma-70 family RNA polymerase sigma factor [Verrucomicrobiota bacterium]